MVLQICRFFCFCPSVGNLQRTDFLNPVCSSVSLFLQAVLRMTASCSGPGCSPHTSWRSGPPGRTTCCSTSAGSSPTSAPTTPRAKRWWAPTAAGAFSLVMSFVPAWHRLYWAGGGRGGLIGPTCAGFGLIKGPGQDIWNAASFPAAANKAGNLASCKRTLSYYIKGSGLQVSSSLSPG